MVDSIPGGFVIAKEFTVPKNLQDLMPSADLEVIPISKLARKGSELLRALVREAKAVTVSVQGHSAMVAMSQRQYDELVELIRRLEAHQENDPFINRLSEQFDQLVAGMNHPDSATNTSEALFADPHHLNATYRPGLTETDE